MTVKKKKLKYRLQSILKLHNKIHNENLKVVASKGLSLYKLTVGTETTSLEIINHKLNEMLNLLADCGMHHEEVMHKVKRFTTRFRAREIKRIIYSSYII